MKDIKIVIGANFGDEGKGKLTDYYTKNADNCIVVCSNGGAQRGHTVLKSDGTRHVFHHFGSGTLNGADTYLPEDFILNPLVFRAGMGRTEEKRICCKQYRIRSRSILLLSNCRA